jgi:amino acid transporter/mannitol/fructose-specific phosphotransferase system IIA component (Ntr-type)
MTRSARFRKELNTLELFCIAAGTMISSGIFILPGLAFAKTGPSVVLAYLLAGALAWVGALSLAELASAMPKAGGDYFFISRSLGPSVGTIVGLVSWVGLALKTAFAIFGICEILLLFTGWNLQLTGLACIAIFSLVNLTGVKFSAFVEILIVTILLAIMLFYVMTGLSHVDPYQFVQFTPHGWRAVFKTTGLVFVAYGGLMKIATIAEEVHNPRKTIARGIFSALVVNIILYSLMLIVVVGTLSSAQLQATLNPIADSAATFLGKPGFLLLTLAGLLAFISTANSGLMAASRYPLALSRDKIFPEIFSHLSPRFQSPVYALFLTSTLVLGALFMPLELLVKAASAFLLLTQLAINIAVIILRESEVRGYRPNFKAPFYPYLQIIGSLLFCLILIDLGWKILAITGLFITLALIVYWSYGRKSRQRNEYALLHLIERLTNRQLAGDNLERELKEIISERDEIVFDRFDHLVDQAIILDLDTGLGRAEFFRTAAEVIAQRLNLNQAVIEQALNARELESTTALNNFVAVPHLVIAGKEIFDLFIFRCRAGINFTPTAPAIKAVFVLIGTADERLFHLRALSAIAQIVFQADFETQWLKARGPSGIKHLIHLAERQRFH